ncbi:MAG: hypothetical protein AB1696_01690 [Planctomycetota bacterium]
MTRIRLRPYHPANVVQYFGCLHLKTEDRRREIWGSQLTTLAEKAYNEDGFDDVVRRIEEDPRGVEIEFVEEYDDICLKCARREKDEKGSVWGKTHSCSSSRNPKVVQNVNRINQEVLGKLGLSFGLVIKLDRLVALLRERMPQVTNPKGQTSYDRGLEVLTSMLGESAPGPDPAASS